MPRPAICVNLVVFGALVAWFGFGPLSGAGANLTAPLTAGAGLPRISLSVPREVKSGTVAVARGKVTRSPRRARVILEARKSRRWRAVGHGKVRRGKFRIPFVLPGGITKTRIRAVLMVGKRRLAISSARKLRVRIKSSPLALTSTALSITTQSPINGQYVSTRVPWQVLVTGGVPTEVDFAIDGTVRWVQATSPYLFGGVAHGLDTTQLSDGAHTLTATAVGPNGESSSSQVNVTVANASLGGSGKVYWGAWIGDQLTPGKNAPPWDMTGVSEFEQETGNKPLSLLEFSAPFEDCSESSCTSSGFPWKPFEDIRAHGAIPFFSWASESTPTNPNEPNFQLSDLIARSHDNYIREFATRAKEWGHPFFLRFDWEMNGTWFPWGEGVNGNQPGEFAAAWRHVHDIFTEVGATKVSWVWCPYVNRTTNLASLYPGNEYVDWTCLDGYNWGTNPAQPSGWRSFDNLFYSTYHQVVDTIAPFKPMVIGETASTEWGGSKAGWIHNMFEWLPTEFPKIRGLIYFEKNGNNMDWPLESSPSALSSFAAGIEDSRYAGSDYDSISASPIPPP
jgi:hypothetical protein